MHVKLYVKRFAREDFILQYMRDKVIPDSLHRHPEAAKCLQYSNLYDNQRKSRNLFSAREAQDRSTSEEEHDAKEGER